MSQSLSPPASFPPVFRSSASIRFNNSGNLLNNAVLLSQVLLSNAGEPEMTFPGSISSRRRLCGHDHAVANREVSGSADLSRENHIAADLRAAGKTDLGAQQRILADHARVTNLNQVIDLGAAPTLASLQWSRDRWWSSRRTPRRLR